MKKTIFILITVAFLCQNVGFGASVLRPPSQFNKATEEFIIEKNKGQSIEINIEEPIEIVKGVLNTKLVTFKNEKENRSAKGRIVVLQPEKIKVDPYVIEEAVEYDFQKYGATHKDKGVISGQKEFKPFPGISFQEWINYVKSKGDVLFVSNATHGGFFTRTDFMIIDGKLIMKPVCGVVENKYKAVTGGPFYVFSFDKGDIGVKSLMFENGKLDIIGQKIKIGMSGVALVLDGQDVTKDIKGIEDGKLEINGYTVPWSNPQSQNAAMSAVGKDRDGNIIFIHMAGDPNEKGEITFSELAYILIKMGVREAIALGASADVNQLVKGDSDIPYVQAKAREGSSITKEDYPNGRPLAGIIVIREIITYSGTTQESHILSSHIIRTNL